ncbi:hypothetical protein [Sphingobium sp. MK2]|uniref:hypothetical protein n=1 Tax=Sphingobium sp. MK2 TaxID=3116540 RepID=UPI0032E35E5D
MAYWTDDRRLDMEQRRLDAEQADAARRIEEKKLRDAGERTDQEERMAWAETQAWED